MKDNQDSGKGFFVHESSYVDADVIIGSGTRVWHFCHILSGTRIGASCVVGQNVMIGPNVRVGDRCKIQNNVSIFKGVTLEPEVFCGPSCVFTNVYNPRAFIERKNEFRETLVKRGATIGANATVLCGNTIGCYAMVAAGAVVLSDVPDYGLAAGVPAVQKGWVCKCGTTLDLRFAIPDLRNELTADDYGAPAIPSEEVKCRSCGNRYRLNGGKLSPQEEG
jgi:UDP-2-acetamido-3-amino-2,3-dideoxy-glucuronate N-acetyltransferase